MPPPKNSLIQRSPDMLLAAYYLSRCSVKVAERHSTPPALLGTKKWNETYRIFSDFMGEGRTERQFANSLKNARDTYDILFENGRIGWIDAHGKPSPISPKFRSIHSEWESRPDSELEAKIAALIAAGTSNASGERDEPSQDSQPDWLQAATADPGELIERVEAAAASLSTLGALPLPPPGATSVASTSAITSRYVRDPNVVAWVLACADGACEACLRPAPFKRADKSRFLEVHHLRPLSEDGPDTTDNAIACCPNCHREMHHGENAETLKAAVIARLARLKEY
jgi:hypothetical protein